jgi:cytochrome c-type biogenesis protein CcmE
MQAGRKFLLGATIIVGAVAYLIVEGVRQTGIYYFTPTELAARAAADSSLFELGVKVGGATVVPGSVRREMATQQIDFRITDGLQEYPVSYRGLVPDTFSDAASNIEVIVEGRLGRDGTFRATEVLAKCGSRYEAAAEDAPRKV